MSQRGEALDEAGSIIGDLGGVSDSGPLGAIGDFAAGAGKLLNWDEDGHWDPSWGGVGDLVNGGLAVASEAGKVAPGVASGVGGAAQAVTNGYDAYRKFKAKANETDPKKRAELEREAWGATGDATLGAAHAATSWWCPAADLLISAGELALDGSGAMAGWAGGDDAKFGAGNVVGGALDAIIPEEEDSWSQQAGNWANRGLGGGTWGAIGGTAVAGLTNVVEAPVNLLDSGAGGLVNTIGNVFDDDDDSRDDYWDQFKGWTWDTAGDAVSTAKGEARDLMTGLMAIAQFNAGREMQPVRAATGHRWDVDDPLAPMRAVGCYEKDDPHAIQQAFGYYSD